MIDALAADHAAAERLIVADQVDNGILTGHKDLLGDLAASRRS
jgi:hypothetical protein